MSGKNKKHASPKPPIQPTKRTKIATPTRDVEQISSIAPSDPIMRQTLLSAESRASHKAAFESSQVRISCTGITSTIIIVS